MQELMKFCRIKLLQYHSILSKQISSNDNTAQQALVGIHEVCSIFCTLLSFTTVFKNDTWFTVLYVFFLQLCSLMDEHVFTPKTQSPRYVEVEPAYEVGESSRLSLISPVMTPVTPTPSYQTAFDLPPPKTDVVMKTFKETEGPVIESTLIISPSHSVPSSPQPSPTSSFSGR